MKYEITSIKTSCYCCLWICVCGTWISISRIVYSVHIIAQYFLITMNFASCLLHKVEYTILGYARHGGHKCRAMFHKAIRGATVLPPDGAWVIETMFTLDAQEASKTEIAIGRLRKEIRGQTGRRMWNISNTEKELEAIDTE